MCIYILIFFKINICLDILFHCMGQLAPLLPKVSCRMKTSISMIADIIHLPLLTGSNTLVPLRTLSPHQKWFALGLHPSTLVTWWGGVQIKSCPASPSPPCLHLPSEHCLLAHGSSQQKARGLWMCHQPLNIHSPFIFAYVLMSTYCINATLSACFRCFIHALLSLCCSCLY